MARMIPENLPYKVPGAERIFFNVLKKLPDSCIVYYESVFKKNKPDFIVIIPFAGVLIIDVRDWRIDHIKTVERDKLELTGSTTYISTEQYINSLRVRCETSLLKPILLQKSGAYKGDFNFPCASLLVLPNITRSEIVNKISDARNNLLARAFTISKDELSELRNIEITETELVKIFKNYFPVNIRRSIHMADLQISAIRALIHPEIVISSPVVGNPYALKTLNVKQEQIALNISAGYKIITGTAGSGKTVLLVTYAKHYAKKNPKKKILFTCFNTTLAAEIRERLKKYSIIEVEDFINFAKERWDIYFWPRASFNEQKVQDNQNFANKIINMPIEPDAKKYDAIIIDETQDFEPAWVQCLMTLRSDPDNCSVIMAGDGNQGIYAKYIEGSWEEIDDIERTKYFMASHRSSNEITEVTYMFLQHFLAQSASNNVIANDDDENLNASISDENNFRPKHGLKPLLLTGDNISDIINEFVTTVKELLHGYFHGNKLTESLAPQDIAILYPEYAGKLKAIPVLRKELSKIAPVQLHPKYQSKILQQSITFSKINEVKGLQYKAVLIFGIETIDKMFTEVNYNEAQILRAKLLYVAMTRAEDFLAIGHVKQSQSPFIDILKVMAEDGFVDL